MSYVLLDKNGLVIQKQPHLQKHENKRGFIKAPDEVVCGMVKQGDQYVIPPPSDEME